MRNKGFTIVELLIVIVVIGILAALVISTFSSAQTRARDTTRINDLTNLKKAVELYKADMGQYPQPGGGYGTGWSGHCPTFGDYDSYIVGLAPKYIKELPKDPVFDTGGQCYLYRSDGIDYSILTHSTMESICGGDPSASCNPDHIRQMDRTCCTQNTIRVASPGGLPW